MLLAVFTSRLCLPSFVVCGLAWMGPSLLYLYCFGLCLLSLSCSPLLLLMFLFCIRLCFWVLLPSHPERLYKMADQVIYSAGFFTLTTTKDCLLQIGHRAGYHRLAHWPRSFETSYGRVADQPGWRNVPSLFQSMKPLGPVQSPSSHTCPIQPPSFFVYTVPVQPPSYFNSAGSIQTSSSLVSTGSIQFPHSLIFTKRIY